MSTPIEIEQNVSEELQEKGEASSEAKVTDPNDSGNGGDKSEVTTAAKADRNASLVAMQASCAYDTDPKNPTMAGWSETQWRDEIEKRFWAEVKKPGSGIKWGAMIFHNRDVDKDSGNAVGLHVHYLIKYDKPVPLSVPRATFGISSQPKNCTAVRNALGACRYLTHLSEDSYEKEKVRYEFDEVKVHNIRYEDMVKGTFWKKAGSNTDIDKLKKKKGDDGIPLIVEENIKNAKLLRSTYGKMVSSGKMTREMAIDAFERAAGTHWVSEFKVDYRFELTRYIRKEHKRQVAEGRPLDLVYFFAEGGRGKTALARSLARYVTKNEYAVLPAAGKNKTPDFFGAYEAEDAVVIDELSPVSFELEEFLNMADPNYPNLAPARYKNAVFVGSKMMMTNSMTPTMFWKDLLLNSNEAVKYRDPANAMELNDKPTTYDKLFQIKRRFGTICSLNENPNNPEEMHVNIFKMKFEKKDPKQKQVTRGEHVYITTLTFTFGENGAPIFTDEFLEELWSFVKTDMATFQPKLTLQGYINTFYNEERELSPLEQFVEEVVSECKWTLLPTSFLHELYRSYMKRNYEMQERLNVKDFIAAISPLMTEWAHSGSRQILSAGRMDEDEPLITEYALGNPWVVDTRGIKMSERDVRNFRRALKYRGFEKL